MHEKEKFRLKKFIKQLEKIKGKHTELVTVYIPAGYNIHEVVSQIRTEQSTAENIKSKQVRKNVTSALEKILRHLSLYKATPENGLAIFCGNISEEEGKTDIELFAIEPPEPIKVKLYFCSQRFDLEPLREMIAEKEIYGLVCMDKSEADIALLIGKKIKPLVHLESIVPGKTRAGGQSSMRFARVREGLKQDWFKQVSETMNKIFSEHPETLGIIVSGPGPTKEEFLKAGFIYADIRKKILGSVSTSYTGDHGLEETVERGENLIYESEVVKEKNLLQKFFSELQKPHGLVVYGLDETLNALKTGAVETIIVSENSQYKIDEKEIIDALEEMVKEYGTKLVIVSSDTREGKQFEALGGIGGFLRYRI